MCAPRQPRPGVVSLAEILPLVSMAYSRRLTRRSESALPDVWDALDSVSDPEIPVLSLWDLGILTAVDQQGDEIIISITPTYSGCPAMDAIRDDIALALTEAGYRSFCVKLLLAPAWSTDWMSPEGRQKLQQYGIAAPQSCGANGCLSIACPQCGSRNTRTISEFGSTACKALYQCLDCTEAFDYFKQI